MPDGVLRSPEPLVARLGPTNTGKTHQAVERMLEWETGMIGLPLRLLAREIYDRVTTRVGEQAVALVTGEEKRIPPRPQYWVCTVEAMPVEHEVEFLAVDEIQLAAHPARGHVFTDRLLHARGAVETWFMGAATMRPLVEQLLPTAHIKSSPRLSQLRGAGSCSLAALPPRSAVVAFSADQVYELAERLRERKGGAAVVLGALSPKTRNAQVALYQSGEVDVMVATDAIGMGLNMDVDHVAFAATRKFDGKETRPLDAAELAQIAGRAGRHMNDGSFGTLAPVPALPDRLSLAIETHRFPAERRLIWRNHDLDTSSLKSLIASLKERPRRPQLSLVAHSEDSGALLHLARQPEIRARASTPELTALLWEVCQIPDYGGHLVEHHAHLLAEVFDQLSGPQQCLDPEYLERNVRRIDDADGDLDTLLMRIELIRTWTYISHHARWIRGAKFWQERTESIEQRLSDALHEQLVQRFVHRPGATGARARKRPRRRQPPEVEQPTRSDSPFGRLLELRLRQMRQDAAGEPDQGDWARELADAPHERFSVDDAARILADDRVIGQLVPGADRLHPEVKLEATGELGAGAESQLRRRLAAWSRDLVGELLAPLRAPDTEELSGAGRGLVYQLEQGLGTVLSSGAREQVKCLTDRDRTLLDQLDLCVGRRLVYARPLLKPRLVRIRVALCTVQLAAGARWARPGPSTVSLPVTDEVPRETYVAIGYPSFGTRAIRADLAERTHQRLTQAARGGSFGLPGELTGWLGCPARELPAVIEAFGYYRGEDGRFARSRRKPGRRRARRPRSAASGTVPARRRQPRSDADADPQAR